MNRNIIHILWMSVTLPLTVISCAREELPSAPFEGDVRPLSITVTDSGYGGAADGQTKAVENAYRTEFTAGDEVGFYIVRDGALVYDNVKLTATSGAGGSLTWQSEAGAELCGGLDGESYYLYYPYRTAPDPVNTGLQGADNFFYQFVINWQPQADQSTYAAYTASDLMIAEGTVTSDGSSLKLHFNMRHKMAMAVIEMPPTVYKFTDAAIPDYTVASSADFTSSAVKPYCIAPGTYRYIFFPITGTAAIITGSYDEGKKEFTVSPNDIATGSCKTYKIDGAAATLKSYTLQPGDYFCKSTDGNWYVIPGEAAPDGNVIGIVFHVGQPPNDQSDYTGSGIGQKKCHGYAVSIKDATSGYCMWGVDGTKLGCYPTDGGGNKLNNHSNPDIDWNGYAWTQKIITAAGGKGNLNASDQAGYPATYYAVVAYETGCNAPTGSSGWFLPSIGQMWNIFQNRSSLFNGKAVVTSLKSDWYWSSSESYDNSAYVALFVNVYRGYVGGGSKDGIYSYVRPVLAF